MKSHTKKMNPLLSRKVKSNDLLDQKFVHAEELYHHRIEEKEKIANFKSLSKKNKHNDLSPDYYDRLLRSTLFDQFHPQQITLAFDGIEIKNFTAEIEQFLQICQLMAHKLDSFHIAHLLLQGHRKHLHRIDFSLVLDIPPLTNRERIQFISNLKELKGLLIDYKISVDLDHASGDYISLSFSCSMLRKLTATEARS